MERSTVQSCLAAPSYPSDIAQVTGFAGVLLAQLLHRAAVHMVFKMTRPSTRSGTKNEQYTRRIPADIIRILDGLPASYRLKGWGKDRISISTGVSDRRAAAAEFSRISAEVEERYAQLRAGMHSLSHKQTVALSGTLYKGLTEAMEDNPGKPEMWGNVVMQNLLARGGKLGMGPLLIGAEARRKASMETRFGRMTDDLLAREGLIVDEASRIPNRPCPNESFSISKNLSHTNGS